MYPSIYFPIIVTLSLETDTLPLIKYWLRNMLRQDGLNNKSIDDKIMWHTCDEDISHLKNVFSKQTSLHVLIFEKEETCLQQIESLLQYQLPVFFIYQNPINKATQNKQEMHLPQHLLKKGLAACWHLKYSPHTDLADLKIHSIKQSCKAFYFYNENVFNNDMKIQPIAFKQMFQFMGTHLECNLPSWKERKIAIYEKLLKEDNQEAVILIDLNSVASQKEEAECLEFIRELHAKLQLNMQWKKKLRIVYLQDPAIESVSINFLQSLAYLPLGQPIRIFRTKEFLLLLSSFFFASDINSFSEKFESLITSPLDFIQEKYKEIQKKRFSASFMPFAWLWHFFAPHKNENQGLLFKKQNTSND